MFIFALIKLVDCTARNKISYWHDTDIILSV